MTSQNALSTTDTDTFSGLALSTDQLFELKNLMDEVRTLEALRGKNALELGSRLKKIRGILGNVPATGSQSAWGKWCDTFMYTRDYAARLIQISEVFENVEGADTLSIRHMREIARIADGSTSIEQLVSVVNQHELGVHELRKLVTDANQGQINLTELIETTPNLKAEIDRRIKEARKDSKEKQEALQAKLREIDAEKAEVETRRLQAENQAKELQKQLKVEQAAVKLGNGNPELGNLIIKLEQAKQEKDNALISLEQTQKALSKVQIEHERWVNSPAGQSKIDFRKTMEDLTKVFKENMTPLFLAAKTNKLNTAESRTEMLKLVDVIQNWVTDVKQALDVSEDKVLGIQLEQK